MKNRNLTGDGVLGHSLIERVYLEVSNSQRHVKSGFKSRTIVQVYCRPDSAKGPVSVYDRELACIGT